MRAAIARNAGIVVDEMASPVPDAGQVLVKSLSCGICGSDLHALKHSRQLQELANQGAGLFKADFDADVVFGHEFCAEILEHGPETGGALKAGDRVVALPTVTGSAYVETVGYSNRVPGGFAQQMVLNENFLLPVPNGLSTERAALTEPMAVGAHAVIKAGLTPQHVCMVIGCGPVGLAVIAALKAAGQGPVVAADFSPARRKLAEVMGADKVVDPADGSPHQSWGAFEVALNRGQKLKMAGEGRPGRPVAIFECVGIPGVIQSIIEGAPIDTRIVVVGVCMEADQFEPTRAIIKEIDMRFVLGYQFDEFAATLHRIAEGEIDVDPLITGRVGLDGVAQAFEDLSNPEWHAKILVDPWA
jgi:threonine dehydrogenase-like Zn-dependent dehydrogenase